MVRLASLALAAGLGCDAAPGPTVDAVAPVAAARGADVVLTGAGFCGAGAITAARTCVDLPSGAVDVGLRAPIVRAPVRSWGAETIVVTVPTQAALGATAIYVTVDGRSSNAVDFEVLP
jgi:hypothetical protein